MNRYDAEHVTTAHPRMTREQSQTIYDRAWHQYYSREHIETLLRRASLSGPRPPRLASMFFTSMRVIPLRELIRFREVFSAEKCARRLESFAHVR